MSLGKWIPVVIAILSVIADEIDEYKKWRLIFQPPPYIFLFQNLILYG